MILLLFALLLASASEVQRLLKGANLTERELSREEIQNLANQMKSRIRKDQGICLTKTPEPEVSIVKHQDTERDRRIVTSSENFARTIKMFADLLSVKDTVKLGQLFSEKRVQNYIKNDIEKIITESYGDVGICRKRSNNDFVIFDARRNVEQEWYDMDYLQHFVHDLFSVPRLQENESLDDYQFYGTFECTYFFARNKGTNKVSPIFVNFLIWNENDKEWCRNFCLNLERFDLDDYNIAFNIIFDQVFVLLPKEPQLDVQFIFHNGRWRKFSLEELKAIDEFANAGLYRLMLKERIFEKMKSKELTAKDYLNYTCQHGGETKLSTQILKMFADNGMEISNEICDCRVEFQGDTRGGVVFNAVNFHSYGKFLQQSQNIQRQNNVNVMNEVLINKEK